MLLLAWCFYPPRNTFTPSPGDCPACPKAPRLRRVDGLVCPRSGRSVPGGSLRRLGRRSGAGVIEDSADFGFVEGLGEQVVGTEVERFGPETGIGLRIGDDHFGFARAFADEMQDILPLSLRLGGVVGDVGVYTL